MRQDPDVILVGEIRDRETAEIAIQASLTGHLVLSTLHTNDAASAVTRLIDIGVAGYKIATAVKGVVAQRLVRRACADCVGAGCESCHGAGYQGRLAIAEILVGSAEFERLVSAGAPTEAIAECGRMSGCATLWESGMALVRRGETTLEELRRVAAEPVRLVTEPQPFASPRALCLGWFVPAGVPRMAALHDELVEAAAALGGHVRIVDLAGTSEAGEGFDAAICTPGQPCGSPGAALVVLLAAESPGPDHVGLLARDADLVLPGAVHGRILLATVLALLRWRSRR
jgi:hypothetical protein